MPNPNPSLNERLAEKLGWRKDPASPGYWIPPAADLPPKGVGYRCPDYLTYAGMGVVLEGMRERGFKVRIYSRLADEWEVAFEMGTRDYEVQFTKPLPLAVAEAALLALEGV